MITLSPQALNALRDIFGPNADSWFIIDDIKYHVNHPNSDQITSSSLIYGVTRGSLSAFTNACQGTQIAHVVEQIYSTAIILGIDPCFALAEAINETDWGRSQDAILKHNWYGYKADYGNPDNAETFKSDSDGIGVPLHDMWRNYFQVGGMYYQDGNGRKLSGWSEKWIDGPDNGKGGMQSVINIMTQLLK